MKTRITQAAIMIWLCTNFGIIRGIMAEILQKGDLSHGAHWSIFLIIAAIMLISVFIPNKLVPFSYVIALGLSLVYQIGLLLGLEEYLIPWDQHKDFFGRNAVGILQTIGYLSCYLVGLGFGRRLYQIAYEDRENEDVVLLLGMLRDFSLCLVVFFFSYFLLDVTSPLACNLTYVSYVLSMGFFIMIISLIPERIIPKLSTNMIYEGAARTSRLIYFTVANVLTGLANSIFELEKQRIVVQFSVMIVYLLLLHIVFALLINYKINVRFW